MTTDTNPQHLIGMQRKFDVLYFLARIGYATTRQLAYFCMGSTSTKTNMVNRTLAKMRGEKLIRERFDRLGTERYVALTAAGARLAADKIPLLKNVVPKAHDNLRHVNSHRTACNGVLAYYLRKYPPTARHECLSELEIASDKSIARMSYWSQTDTKTLNKTADCELKILRDGRWHTHWVEVENCSRSPRDLKRLVAFCRQWYRSRYNNFDQQTFVVADDSARAIGRRLTKALNDAGENDDELRRHIPGILDRVQILKLNTASNELLPLPN